MKQRFPNFLAIGCLTLFSLFGRLQVEAGTTYENNQTAGNWSTPSVWGVSSGYPGEDGDLAIFTGSSAWRTMVLDVNPTFAGVEVNGYWEFAAALPSSSMLLRADPDTLGSPPPVLYVGVNRAGGNGENASGRLTVASGVTLSLEGGRFLVGTPEINVTNPAPRVGTGVVTIADGATLNIGTQAERSQWLVAQHYAIRQEAAQKTSSVTANAGATVSAWLTELQVGNNHGASDGSVLARLFSGTVDLSAATVTVFDVSGDVVIGSGVNHIRGSNGTVVLPEMSGKIGGNVLVGDSVTGDPGFGSSGLLDLKGTHLEVGGNVKIDLTGRVKVVMGEGAAGLLLSESSTLTINALGSAAGDANAGYFIDFMNVTLSDEGFLYGLAWEGERLEELALLVDSFAITWTNPLDGPTVGLFYDASSDLTYIGIAAIPEPGPVSLLLGGVALLGWISRLRSKKMDA